ARAAGRLGPAHRELHVLDRVLDHFDRDLEAGVLRRAQRLDLRDRRRRLIEVLGVVLALTGEVIAVAASPRLAQDRELHGGTEQVAERLRALLDLGRAGPALRHAVELGEEERGEAVGVHAAHGPLRVVEPETAAARAGLLDRGEVGDGAVDVRSVR